MADQISQIPNLQSLDVVHKFINSIVQSEATKRPGFPISARKLRFCQLVLDKILKQQQEIIPHRPQCLPDKNDTENTGVHLISSQLQEENSRLRWELAHALDQISGSTSKNEIIRDPWVGKVQPPDPFVDPQIKMVFVSPDHPILHPQPCRPEHRALVRQLPSNEVSHYLHSRTPPPEKVPRSFFDLPIELQLLVCEELLNAPLLGTAEATLQDCTLYDSFLAFPQTCRDVNPICEKILYEDNTFFAAFTAVPNSEQRQHAIVSPLTRTWHSQRSYMASNYVDQEMLDRLSKVLHWKLYLRPDNILPRLSGVISFCHALTHWDHKGQLCIEILLEPKDVTKNAFEYRAQILEALKPFFWLRNIKSFTIRLAKEEEVEVFSDDLRLQRFEQGSRNMQECKSALRSFLNSSAIVPRCKGNTRRILFVRLWLNLLRYYQAFEMDIHLRHRMAFNADGQVEFNPDGTKFPDSDFAKLDLNTQKSRNLFLKHFYTDGNRLGALDRARGYVTTSDFANFTIAVTELRDGLDAHQRNILWVRTIKPDWFDPFISGKAPLDEDNWWPAWKYVKSYSDSFFRYDLNRRGLEEHSNTRDTLLGIKSNLPVERILREAKTQSSMTSVDQEFWRFKLGKAMKILNEQWKEVESARDEMDQVYSGRWRYQNSRKYFGRRSR